MQVAASALDSCLLLLASVSELALTVPRLLTLTAYLHYSLSLGERDPVLRLGQGESRGAEVSTALHLNSLSLRGEARDLQLRKPRCSVIESDLMLISQSSLWVSDSPFLLSFP